MADCRVVFAKTDSKERVLGASFGKPARWNDGNDIGFRKELSTPVGD